MLRKPWQKINDAFLEKRILEISEKANAQCERLAILFGKRKSVVKRALLRGLMQ
jgi:hypothetical protein